MIPDDAGSNVSTPEPNPSRSLSRFRIRSRLHHHGSLRAQLALWQAGILALTLVFIALFTFILLKQFLNSRADTRLNSYAETTALGVKEILAQYAAIHPGKELSKDPDKQTTYRTFVNNSDLQSLGRYVQVIDRTNHVVAYSDALQTNHLPPSMEALTAGLAGQTSLRTEASMGKYPIRIVTVPVRFQGGTPFLVEVGASVEGVEEALWRATIVLLVLTPSVFVITLVGGWLLVGKALRPVDEMTQAALSIESNRLNTRLSPAETDNEIGRLALALNGMIARLERSFQQIERFSADASHELKTPLTSIRGEAEVALMSDLTTEQYKSTLRSIVEETERLTIIVNNLLVLARADANQIKMRQDPIALHEVVLASFEQLAGMAFRKNITLDIGEMDEVTIAGDAIWIQQLITNLLKNAINYTPEGGDVTLGLRLDSSSGSDVARIYISDTGPGIPAEHVPHLFDRFYRVDSGRSRDQGGTGLGLNIARWIVESHRGTIEVQTEPGRGSTFTAVLPV